MSTKKQIYSMIEFDPQNLDAEVQNINNLYRSRLDNLDLCVNQLFTIMSTKKQINSMIEIDPKNLEAKVQYTNNLDLLYELCKFMCKHPSNCHQLLYFFSDNVQITLNYDKNTTKFCWKYDDTWYLKRYRRINFDRFIYIWIELGRYNILNTIEYLTMLRLACKIYDVLN